MDDLLRSHNPHDREPRGDYFLYQRLAYGSGDDAEHQSCAHFGGTASMFDVQRSMFNPANLVVTLCRRKGPTVDISEKLRLTV